MSDENLTTSNKRIFTPKIQVDPNVVLQEYAQRTTVQVDRPPLEAYLSRTECSFLTTGICACCSSRDSSCDLWLLVKLPLLLPLVVLLRARGSVNGVLDFDVIIQLSGAITQSLKTHGSG